MRVLIVEDEPDLRRQVAGYFEEEGFTVELAADGEQGCYLAVEYPIDLAVIDLGLPRTPGIDIIREARRTGRDYPILILTARDSWQTKVEGLEAGADDYVVKPFHKEELMARSRALLRRSGGWAHSVLQSGPFALDTKAKQLTADGDHIELTAYEYRVLEYLLLHAGDVISKTTLSEHLYSDDEERDSNVIEVFIRRLRTKLDPDDQLHPIETLRGQGYRWVLPRANAEEA